MAQGIRGIEWVSTNAVSWTQRQAGNGDYLFGATFAQGLFVAVGGPFSGGSQKIATSPAGAHWKIRPAVTQLSPCLQAVAYGNGSFVAVSEKGIILQSDPTFRLAADDAASSAGPRWILIGEAGRSYHFQYSENLGASNWLDVTRFTSTGETEVLRDPGAGAPGARFYRSVSP